MAIILSLETSTDVCSVALHNNGVLIRHAIVKESQAHASKLAPLISDIFNETPFKISDLSAVAISSGPGSYTGLRIGTSTAKGICFALDIPFIAIPTLKILAKEAKQHVTADALICPMLDARRMEVYCQIFDYDLESQSHVEAKIIESGSFAELLTTQKMFFLGNGAAKCKGTITSHNAFFLDDIVPLAAELGYLAQERFVEQKFEDLSAFEPFYLKQFEAKKAKSVFQ
jgi:tRNA threonylcarbamoyladenosine biosynthesis protein TsaB